MSNRISKILTKTGKSQSPKLDYNFPSSSFVQKNLFLNLVVICKHWVDKFLSKAQIAWLFLFIAFFITILFLPVRARWSRWFTTILALFFCLYFGVSRVNINFFELLYQGLPIYRRILILNELTLLTPERPSYRFHACMIAHRVDSLLVKFLDGIPSKPLLFESRERHINCFESITDSVPSLFDNLASLLVRHRRVLAFYLSSCLSFVNPVWTHSLDLRPCLKITSGFDFLHTCPKFIWLHVDLLKLSLILVVQSASLTFVMTPLSSTQSLPLFLDLLLVHVKPYHTL